MNCAWVAAYARTWIAHQTHGWVLTARPTRLSNASRLSRGRASVQQITRSQSTAIQLRPYQEECIKAVLDYVRKGERRLGVSLATGSGKTVVFSHLIDRLPAPSPDATQSLILAHRQELVEQAARHCRALYPEKNVEVEMAKQAASGLADITVASVQSLNSGQRLRKYDAQRFKLLLVDEAHHMIASSYLAVLRHFGLLENALQQHTTLVGVSATFSRQDGLSLGKAIDHIVYHKDYLDMIEDDWLANMTFTTVCSGADLTKVKTTRGDFQTSSLSKAVNDEATNATAVRSWLAKAPGRKSTLVFCVDLSHVASLTAMFRRHGVDAHFITGDTQSKIRVERLEAFKKGEFPVLLNCGIFTEGTDIPNIDCILLARPTRSRNLLVQMIGRGLRKHAGKQNCHVIDMVASLETGIVTTPTLFGLDPDELVDNANPESMKSMKERKVAERLCEEKAAETIMTGPDEARRMPALTGNVTFTDYDNVNDLIEDTSGERHIRAISSHAWVQIDEARYILSSSNGDFLTIKHDHGNIHYDAIFTQKLPRSDTPKSPYARPRQIAKACTFLDAVHAADNYAKAKMPFQYIAKNAQWRRSPASDTQVALLNKYRSEDDKLEPHAITKGRAGDLITKLKHGARGRLSKIKVAQRKAERVKVKKDDFREMQRGAEVRVGPLKTPVETEKMIK